MFRLDHDMARRFLYVELRGFWTREVLARFHDEAGLVLQRAIASGATPGEGHILVNANGFPVQDRTIAEEIAQFIPLYGKLARRIAVVGSDSSLQRLQAKRLIGENGKLFDNDEAAKTWLFSADRTGTAHAGTGRADIITARSAPDRSASSMTGF